ncbi:hypothetical protein CBR_g55247 [Chara braunii]|uniref:Beta-amylase n=1 Tax=Chara braunii TaxID=69332 RepID=A0A388MCS4_CHABU|nr:hypothetical protein CBR_g55247 [Chara braunii]|eukprot:GBG92366.1 hypothetical protein CBR_g55247 [Chara braunii]
MDLADKKSDRVVSKLPTSRTPSSLRRSDCSATSIVYPESVLTGADKHHWERLTSSSPCYSSSSSSSSSSYSSYSAFSPSSSLSSPRSSSPLPARPPVRSTASSTLPPSCSSASPSSSSSSSSSSSAPSPLFLSSPLVSPPSTEEELWCRFQKMGYWPEVWMVDPSTKYSSKIRESSSPLPRMPPSRGPSSSSPSSSPPSSPSSSPPSSPLPSAPSSPASNVSLSPPSSRRPSSLSACTGNSKRRTCPAAPASAMSVGIAARPMEERTEDDRQQMGDDVTAEELLSHVLPAGSRDTCCGGGAAAAAEVDGVLGSRSRQKSLPRSSSSSSSRAGRRTGIVMLPVLTEERQQERREQRSPGEVGAMRERERERGRGRDAWRIHDVWDHASPGGRGAGNGVPVYIMLPLDTVNMNNTLTRPRALRASLTALKSAGVEGVMVDVWWGIVEGQEPHKYRWTAYQDLVKMVHDAGLKMQVVMSFHQCGGNVGDSCLIPLPQWVLQEIEKNPDIVYTDKAGKRNLEYLSLGCDSLPVLRGRSPVQAYADFMRSFRNVFASYLGNVISEIQVGLGPAGELRYPSYPESYSRWRFPGIGEFQCYDKHMLANLKAAAEAIGKPRWGLGGPHDAGSYNQWPEETGFFQRDGSWKSQYGHFFLQWYSEMLLRHGDLILSSAAGIFRGTGAMISAKIAGIHWHYYSRSHAAELTAGYYNTWNRDGYLPIARMLARHGAILNFTCFEMRDSEQMPQAACSPESLLRQVVRASKIAGVRVSGENALQRFDLDAYEQIVRKSRLRLDGLATDEPMMSFTFLRTSEMLFRPNNWSNFVAFVRNMSKGTEEVMPHWVKEKENHHAVSPPIWANVHNSSKHLGQSIAV